MTANLLLRGSVTSNAIAIPEVIPTAAGRSHGLFPFQSQMVRRTYDLIRANQTRILWIAAPSAGKTRISGQVMLDATQRAKKPIRTAFVVEMDVLAQQTLDTYLGLGLNATLYKADADYNPDADVVVISSQTLEQRAKRGKTVQELVGSFGLVLGDEIHTLSQRRGWALLNDAYKNTSTVFIGMTGTPWNQPKKALCNWFDVQVEAPQPPELVKMGRLVIVRGMRFSDNLFDVSELKWRDGDYGLKEQEEQAFTDNKLQLVFDNYQRDGQGRTFIAYCTGIKHAKALAEFFTTNGIPCDYQIGETPTKRKRKTDGDRLTREEQHAQLKSGELRGLFTVGTCTKGYDAPFVSCIILARAIGNKNLYHQTSCRGNRAHTYPDGSVKQDCILIDLGGNCERFGHLPTDYQDYWKALQRPGQTNKWDAEDNYKSCYHCGQDRILKFAKVCPSCGHEFGGVVEEQNRTLFDLSAFVLEEYFGALGQEQVQFLRSRKVQYFQEGKHPDTAVTDFAAKFGHLPPVEWHQYAVFGKRSSREQKARFMEYLKPFSPHDFWLQRQMQLEFGGAGSTFAKFLAKWNTHWWDVLGVAADCRDMAIVKRQYVALMKEWHPDVCEDQTNAKVKTQILNKAYEEAKQCCI
ncbi:MAG: DEAD/DEAH box helicase family protein [Microcoleus sp.]